MLRYSFVLFFCLMSASCSEPPNIVKNNANADNRATIVTPSNTSSTVVTTEKPLETLDPTTGKIVLPMVSDFGIFDVIRKSEIKDGDGRVTPPFSEATINIGLDKEPKAGEKATFIPLGVDIEPFQLAILKSEKKNFSCSDDSKTEYYWDVEMEKITASSVLSIAPLKDRHEEYPFDVVGIYPAVKFAKRIEAADLRPEMLPKGVTAGIVEAAIDLDNDKSPDLILTSFCCSKPDQLPGDENDCYVCTKSYRKLSGRWTLADSAEPC